MNCSYCGLATGAEARWEVSTGSPGEGMTRYPCDQHLPAACRLVGQVGDVRVFEHNRTSQDKDIPRVGELAGAVLAVIGRSAA